MIHIPIRTVPGKNAREHHMARARRVKAERNATAWVLANVIKPALPCLVRITRISPSAIPLDDDNLAGSVAAIRDQVAAWLGIDDGRKDIVAYVPAQERGAWGVRIEFTPMVREDTPAGNGRMGEWCGA